MTTLVLEPVDTLFFRDGRPYNQGDPGQIEAASVFPPHPPTVVGAVRAALARAMGWQPDSPWPADRLGDGVDWQAGNGLLGPLRFAGPYLLDDDRPLFPAPLHLLARWGQGGAEFVTRLGPSPTPLATDRGEVRLPAPVKPEAGLKPLEGCWLDVAAMARVLGGGEPDPGSIVHPAALWLREPRVGIRRDASRRPFAEGGLYAAAHARLAPGVALAVDVSGLDRPWPAGGMAPLGGEGRSAWIEERGEAIGLPAAPDLRAEADAVLRYMVLLITPADPADGVWPGPGDPLTGGDGSALPGRIVSACIGRPVPVGGWDSAARRPLPLRPLIPAGSVWFMEAGAGDAAAAAAWHGQAIGQATGWGFGRVLIGRWKEGGGAT